MVAIRSNPDCPLPSKPSFSQQQPPVHHVPQSQDQTQLQVRHPPSPPQQLPTMSANGQAQKPMTVNDVGGQHGPNGVLRAAASSTHHLQHPTYPTKTTTAPTTMVTRQNTATLSNMIAAPMGEPAELLRQTLQSAPNSRPNSRSSSRRRNSSTPATPRTIYTPNGSAENSEGEGPRHDDGGLDTPRMRHGFEDEYNSEDYLAVLEQVRAFYLRRPHESNGGCTGFLYVLHRQAT